MPCSFAERCLHFRQAASELADPPDSSFSPLHDDSGLPPSLNALSRFSVYVLLSSTARFCTEPAFWTQLAIPVPAPRRPHFAQQLPRFKKHAPRTTSDITTQTIHNAYSCSTAAGYHTRRGTRPRNGHNRGSSLLDGRAQAHQHSAQQRPRQQRPASTAASQ